MLQNAREYQHLLAGAAPDLDCVCCLEIDEIHGGLSVASLLNISSILFENWSLKPKRVTYSLREEGKSRRASFATIRNRFGEIEDEVGRSITYIEISGAGIEQNEISDVWTPCAFAGGAMQGRILNAFFFGPAPFDEGAQRYIELLRANRVEFASAQIFSFPWVYSPVAYFAGATYDHSDRRLGKLTPGGSARITNWRSHCHRGNRPSQGYMRDVYPLNILSREHICNELRGVSLLEWISTSPSRGEISEFGSKCIWRIADQHIAEVQRSLDEAGLLLAGSPPESK